MSQNWDKYLECYFYKIQKVDLIQMSKKIERMNGYHAVCPRWRILSVGDRWKY